MPNDSPTGLQAIDVDSFSASNADLPRLFNVVLLNDDHTPMDFVVDILMRFCGHPRSRARRIMLATHNHGRGVAGTYPRDIAEAKADQIVAVARSCSYPFRTITEPEPNPSP